MTDFLFDLTDSETFCFFWSLEDLVDVVLDVTGVECSKESVSTSMELEVVVEGVVDVTGVDSDEISAAVTAVI